MMGQLRKKKDFRNYMWDKEAEQSLRSQLLKHIKSLEISWRK